MTELAKWDSFYVIVGSAAGALIGLQVVVVALIADRPELRASEEASNAFATPNIVHFGAVLLLSAMLRAPWDSAATAAVLSGILGAAGLVYAAIVTRRMRKQTAYVPVFEDWLCHAVLPLVAYGVFAASTFVARSHKVEALFAVGGASLLLLFVGIHNAWDTASYHVFVRLQKSKPKPKS
jgi:hypothetical protein